MPFHKKHGDFIYSVKICSAASDPNSSIELPFWVYGRNIRFRKSYVVFDAVEKHKLSLSEQGCKGWCEPFIFTVISSFPSVDNDNRLVYNR
jgi:hypothetical protein